MSCTRIDQYGATMALIKCDECGTAVSDRASACPKCGNPIISAGNPVPKSILPKEKSKGALGALVAVLLVFLVAGGFFGGHTGSHSGSTGAVRSAGGSADSVDACTRDYRSCKDNSDLINHNGQVIDAQVACKMATNSNVKYGEPDWPFMEFTSFFSGANYVKTGIIDLVDNNVKIQNQYGALARSRVVCEYDLRAKKAIMLMINDDSVVLDQGLFDKASALDEQFRTATSAPPDSRAAPAAASDELGLGAASSAASTQRATTYSTSFDCAKAHSDSEHLICGDAELAADDVELAGLYAKAKAVTADRATFKEHVRKQWNYREHNCHDRGCVAHWYADQKQWFRNFLNGQVGGTTQPQASRPQSAATYRASFDCSAPSFLDEQVICHDPGLAAMDRELAAQYSAAAKRASDPAKLKADEDSWVASRRDCGGDLSCLRRAYGVRIDQLRQF